MRFLITGGSRGIGATLVLDTIAAGHEVAFTYRARADSACDVMEQAQRLAPGCRCLAYPLDIRDPLAVEEVGEAVLADLGGLDVVVCNAAVNRTGLAATFADEDWQEVLQTNLSGTFYVCRFFLSTFLTQRRGRFIHISSVGMHGMSPVDVSTGNSGAGTSSPGPVRLQQAGTSTGQASLTRGWFSEGRIVSIGRFSFVSTPRSWTTPRPSGSCAALTASPRNGRRGRQPRSSASGPSRRSSVPAATPLRSLSWPRRKNRGLEALVAVTVRGRETRPGGGRRRCRWRCRR
jgi:NAD(P)-dependent dehydrogenase (short-subunit alcohol dehydrogenase family)